MQKKSHKLSLFIILVLSRGMGIRYITFQAHLIQYNFSREKLEILQKLLHISIVSLQKPLDVTNHSVAREVVTFFTLPPGDYIVVPQTNVPNLDGKFLLRIFTDEQSNIW